AEVQVCRELRQIDDASVGVEVGLARICWIAQPSLTRFQAGKLVRDAVEDDRASFLDGGRGQRDSSRMEGTRIDAVYAARAMATCGREGRLGRPPGPCRLIPLPPQRRQSRSACLLSLSTAWWPGRPHESPPAPGGRSRFTQPDVGIVPAASAYPVPRRARERRPSR